MFFWGPIFFFFLPSNILGGSEYSGEQSPSSHGAYILVAEDKQKQIQQ